MVNSYNRKQKNTQKKKTQELIVGFASGLIAKNCNFASGLIAKTLCCTKENRYKRVHIVCFHSDKIPDNENDRMNINFHWDWDGGEVRSPDGKSVRRFYDFIEISILYLDCGGGYTYVYN